MHKKTIKKLNQLNRKFYTQTAKYFSQTRQRPWQGWHDLLPFIKEIEDEKEDFKVLDLGCGNGRFGVFLKDHLENEDFYYLGIDSNQELLKISKRQLDQAEVNYDLQNVDIVNHLLVNEIDMGEQFDLIVAFGLMHHIPGYKLRQRLLQLIKANLTDIGIGVLTLWQFAQKPRFIRKGVNPNKVGLDRKELEDNDYILDWQRGVKALRYCHFVNKEEKNKLVSSSKLNLIDEFLADGEGNNLNKYLILNKGNE